MATQEDKVILQDKPCVVCFTTPNQRFLEGARRIKEALDDLNFRGDFLHWHQPHDCLPDGCPSHLDSPWGFKPWAIKAAYARGYRAVLWLDSSVVPADIDAIFGHISTHGSYLVRRLQQESAKRMVANACSDAALEMMGVCREAARKIPQISAQRVGLDLRNNTSLQFLKELHRASLDGVSFKGYTGPSSERDYHRIYNNIDGFASSHSAVLGHRHDQTVASFIVHKLGMPWFRERDGEAVVDKAFVHERSTAFL